MPKRQKTKPPTTTKAAGPQKAPARPEPARGAVAPRPGGAEPTVSPFARMRRFSEAMDRLFDDARTQVFPRLDWPKMDAAWAPPVEMTERAGQLVVRAELPGLAKKDVRVEIREDALTIAGERRHEREERRKGYFRSERSYGSFFRQVPLPEGIDPTSATATFKDGILEVTMPAPPKPAKGRSVPIEGT